MKKKKDPGVFFSNPEDKGVTKESKETINTFIEGENEPPGAYTLSEDYQRFIDVSYGQEREKKKKKKK
jgi:hypothetical protein